MSGGSLGYFYNQLESHVGDFDDKELDDLVRDLVKLFHDREWFLSSDTCEGSWVESRDAFKKKWFESGSRSKRIAKYLDDIRTEVLKSFGISDKYCRYCEHWTPEEEEGSPYGTCDLEKRCLMDRYECCEEFSRLI